MYGNKERGMFLKQPAHRLRKLRKLCQQHHVPLPAALSLRRHHIKLRNTSLNMTQLGLGNVKDINASAQVFENAVAECLQRNQVQFYSEAEQRAYSKQHKPPNDKRFPVTPDFILQEPLRIKVFHYDKQKRKRCVLQDRSVHCTLSSSSSSAPAAKLGNPYCYLSQS